MRLKEYLYKLGDKSFAKEVHEIYPYDDFPKVMRQIVKTTIEMRYNDSDITGILGVIENKDFFSDDVDSSLDVIELGWSDEQQDYFRWAVDFVPLHKLYNHEVVISIEKEISDAEIVSALLVEIFFIEVTDEEKEETLKDIVSRLDEVRSEGFESSESFKSSKEVREYFNIPELTQEEKEKEDTKFKQDLEFNKRVFSNLVNKVKESGLTTHIKNEESE